MRGSVPESVRYVEFAFPTSKQILVYVSLGTAMHRRSRDLFSMPDGSLERAV